ncbi:Gfo/Idh/MocA family protein [Candidatus Halobonum tyrrellensis]|uniref:Oxidoreductase domain-containing protein n=1 Tax=Candidatus Halobonum tyrrellensis G22 TaxID=1324957 RepID=V4GQP2_9EURY|nr:Gfo/Idh/MocA family oxidoreductase [Candidatus Halobonum tyrrellensis]ESP87351.1 oxidoreductase domain-containing protein [Candidatus Halobonum tyrrellensis G22]
MSDPIRYGVVGVGGYGSTHAEAVASVEGAEVVAGAATSESSVRPFAATYDATGYTDHAEMLAAEDLDAVSVCTPSGTHAEVGIDAVEAGVAPLVEKPLDVYIDRVDRLVDAADANGVPLGGVFQRRFTPERWTARRWADEGRFGDLVCADAAVKYHRPQSYYDDGWHGTRELDGGVLLQQAVHFVDLLGWLTGGIDRVDAATETLAHDMECEDLAVVRVGFENGGRGTITATTAVRGAERERVEVNGTEGSYSSGRFAVGDETVDPDLVDPPHGTGLEGQVREFVDAVREGRDPAVDGRDAREAVEVVLAAYASASLDREVRVDELRDLTDHTRNTPGRE